jgi:superfamily II DNA/RNA helicase
LHLLLQYEREAALKDFSAGTVRVLIATDVASRGLDVKDVGHVINMDLPRAFEDYVHRIGKQHCSGFAALSVPALSAACGLLGVSRTVLHHERHAVR